MRKFFKILGIVILIAIFIGTLGFLYKKSLTEPDVFETEHLIITNILMKTVATGSVVPRKEIEIKPQVSGIIDEIFVEAGNKVNKGDVLARVKIIPDMVNLNSAESRVKRAGISHEDAKLDFGRQKRLFDKQVISSESYLDAKLAFESAKEEMESAENHLQLIKEGVTKKSKTATNTLIRATINGMILDVPVKEGNSVIQSNTFNDGTTIAIVADMNDMIFEGKVDETEVGKIQEGMKMDLSIGAIEDEKFEAILEYISPKGVEENGAIQFEIKATVTLMEEQFIRAGYSANADIVLERRDSVPALPEGLLLFENDSAFVEVETGPQEYERRNIETGISDGINIEILSGLTKEDRIKGSKVDPDKDKKDKKM
jgi:HlyD family secretion protein